MKNITAVEDKQKTYEEIREESNNYNYNLTEIGDLEITDFDGNVIATI